MTNSDRLSEGCFIRRMCVCLLLVSMLIGALLAPAFCSERQYKLALPGYKFNFPRDHASHDEYRTEWWYYTGHLQGEDGTKYGYELTFFRSALEAPRGLTKGAWAAKNIYLTHFAVSDLSKQKFFYDERLTRPGIGFAGADSNRFKVWNQNWHAGFDNQERHILSAGSPEYAIDLTLQSDKPPAIHGENGVSQKASCTGCASHYYSFTRLKTVGTIRVGTKTIKVTGSSWMDHEFGSNQLTADQIGWDWFSIQLEDQTEVMLYNMRLKNGTIDANSSGTIIAADGSVRHLKKGEYTVTSTGSWRSPQTKGLYPMGWHVTIPSIKAELTISPALENQELAKRTPSQITYWEGACLVKGTEDKKAVLGQAYVEMTGYHEHFGKTL
jgi:predicted secreted hydrolase